MNTTIRHLIRECPKCGNIVKLVMKDDEILEIEGAEAPRLCIYKTDKRFKNGRRIGSRPRYAWTGAVSKKIVCCLAMTEEHMDGVSACWQAMRISKFKEIVL